MLVFIDYICKEMDEINFIWCENILKILGVDWCDFKNFKKKKVSLMYYFN